MQQYSTLDLSRLRVWIESGDLPANVRESNQTERKRKAARREFGFSTFCPAELTARAGQGRAGSHVERYVSESSVLRSSAVPGRGGEGRGLPWKARYVWLFGCLAVWQRRHEWIGLDWLGLAWLGLEL